MAFKVQTLLNAETMTSISKAHDKNHD